MIFEKTQKTRPKLFEKTQKPTPGFSGFTPGGFFGIANPAQKAIIGHIRPF